MLTLDKIYHAAFVLKGTARKTDLIASPALSGSNNVYLKTENLQATGSFKLRGAYYKISQLDADAQEKGIIACSAGNHAQGVALASQRKNLKCLICMPDSAPISKVEATKSYGAEVCLVKDTYDDAYAKAVELQKEHGYTFIHPFNDEDVIAGQGTIGLEILDQLENVDAVIVPIGGGGLLSGVAFAIKNLRPECKVYGVQAARAASMYNSYKNKEIQPTEKADTFADGIAVKTPGDLTYDIISKYVDDVATVSEDEIAEAILFLMEKQKLVSEGAGAVSVAAMMYNKFNLEGKNVVCLISGGNIDVTILNRVITRGLLMSGRRTTFTLAMHDKPGQLEAVAGVIGRLGGNVVNVFHDSSDPDMPVNSCFVRIIVETRDKNHVEQIRKALKEENFDLV